MHNDLHPFIKESLIKNATREEIRHALEKAGWQKEEIDGGLADFADQAFVVPVPKRKPYTSAKEGFLYVVQFLTLYITVISFGTIWFQYLNRWFPLVGDPNAAYYLMDSTSSIIRSAVSMLIVTFPAFLLASRTVGKLEDQQIEKRTSPIKNNFTYFSLFIATCTIIGTLITLVNVLLQGEELTARFILKVLLILGLSGASCGYFLWDLRQNEKALTEQRKAS